MHHRKYDTPANTFRISYQALDHEWEERQVEGTEEVMLTDLMPCTVFNIKVAGCNLIGCSPASQTVQQQTLVSPESGMAFNMFTSTCDLPAVLSVCSMAER